MHKHPIQLIVGLANPGKEYALTRHNAGAWFVQQLAEQHKILLRADSKLQGLHYAGLIDHRPCHLLIPTTFMNHSGQAVAACMKYYKIAPHSVLIAHDDIDLSVGDIRLKYDGGDGGHNGLKDIIRHLSTKQFYRLRIGVGRPVHDTVDYVLNKPSKADQQKIMQAISDAELCLSLIMQGEIAKAMQQLHTEKE